MRDRLPSTPAAFTAPALGLLASAALLCLAASPAPAGELDRREPGVSPPHEEEVLRGNGEEVVFRTVSSRSKGQKRLVLRERQGKVDGDLYQRYARPFAYTDSSIRHHFAATYRRLPDGGAVEVVQVTAAPGRAAVVDVPRRPTLVDRRLLELDAGSGPVTMMIQIRDFPEWDVPLRPQPDLLSPSEHAASLTARELALVERELAFAESAEPVADAVERAGGSVVAARWEIGWLVAELPLQELDALAAHPAVQAVVAADQSWEIALSNKAAERPTHRMGAQQFWNSGQTGDEPNPARHSYGAITIASIDTGPVKDEARAFCQDSACTSSKIALRYRCDVGGQNPCVAVANYLPFLEDFDIDATNHSTTVATAAVSDYLDGQAISYPLGDTGYAWQNAATSAAREAKLITLGALGGFHFPGNALDSYTAALGKARFHQADVLTSATAVTVGACTIASWLPNQQMAENAFDDGAFYAMSAGNEGGATASACNIDWTPSMTPKVFTVNGLDMLPAGCDADYRNCKLDLGNSARGGADAVVGGVTRPAAVSIIDMVVPQNLSHFTRCGTPGASSCSPYGQVITNAGDSGTSFAAPRLAGLAAVAKDYFLDTGQSWFNNPGWLHTFMLGQGDGHRSSVPSVQGLPTYQLHSGVDDLYGMGRIKMRHPDQFSLYGHDFRSLTFTTTTPYNFFVGGVPLDPSTETLKCVMVQHEDMSIKTDVARVKLEVWLKTPTGGGGCSQRTASHGYLKDDSFDTKHAITFRADQGQVGGYCAHARVTPLVLPNTGSAWVQTFCYAADELDDEPS